MSQLDLATTRAINDIAGRFAPADLLMIWVSAIGVPIIVAAVAIQWRRREDRRNIRHVLVASGFSLLLGLAFNQIILLFVHRIRPYDARVTYLLIARSADFSLPSDHATAAFAIASAFFFHRMRRAGLGFLTGAALVSFSRVYVGTHYVGDVLGGALTGILAARFVRVLYQEGTAADRWITGVL
ncbi:MAG: phosphatase PAP2 family protein [Roseiarcus sp.]